MRTPSPRFLNSVTGSSSRWVPSESDRAPDGRRRGGGGIEPDPHRKGRPPVDGAGQRSGRGPVSGGGRGGRHVPVPSGRGWRPWPTLSPARRPMPTTPRMPPWSSCRSTPRPRPRPSPPDGVIDDGPGSSGVVRPSASPSPPPRACSPSRRPEDHHTSSTVVQALTDAVLYLHDYRYDSAEGYASGIHGLSALREMSSTPSTPWACPTRPGSTPRSSVTSPAGRPPDDDGGGFLLLGSEAGDRSPGPPSRPPTPSSWPTTPGIGTRPTPSVGPRSGSPPSRRSMQATTDPMRASLSAWSCIPNVRHPAGLRRRAGVGRLPGAWPTMLQPDESAWLWPVLADTGARAEIERELTNRAVDTAGAATFANPTPRTANWIIAASDRRTDGIVLDDVISAASDSDLIPKVVAGLLGSQVRGRLEQRAGERLHPGGDETPLRRLRGCHPRLRGPGLAGDHYLSASTFEGRTTDRAFTLCRWTR